MKKILILLASLWLTGMAKAYVQSSDQIENRKEEIRQNRKMAKLTKKEIDSQVLKDAKKEAKRLKKEGWKAAPGSLPAEKQVSNLLYKRYERCDNFPTYIVGKSSGKAATYGVARKIAITRARAEIAEMISAEIAVSTKLDDKNTELTNSEVETVAKMVSEVKQLAIQSIKATDIVMELYRESEGTTEVMIGLTYDGKESMNIVRNAFGNDNKSLLDKIMQ